MCTNLRENQILSIGSPLVDIIVCVESELLSKYKLKRNDATVADVLHDELFKEISRCDPILRTGGSVTTTARVLQRLLKFPKCSCYLGAVGVDAFASIIENDLKQERVNYILEKIADVPTGRCAVLLTGKHRSLVTDLGASKCFSKKSLMKANVPMIMQGAEYFYMSGFFLGVSYETIEEISNHATRNHKTFVLNIGASFLCEKYKREFKTLVHHTSVLIGNRDEAISLAESFGIANEDVEEIARELTSDEIRNNSERTKPNLTIITNGPEPIIVAQGGDVSSFDVPEVAIAKITHTNGAGDYFVAGFLTAYVQNWEIGDCVTFGIEVAIKFIQEDD